MSARQHVWLGREATAFDAPCEACLARRDYDTWGLAVTAVQVTGTLSPGADVGFATCSRGHRIVVHRAQPAGERRLRATG